MKIYYTANKDTVFSNGQFTCKKQTLPSGAFREAFYSCTPLTSVSFPELTSVETETFSRAFYYCTNLTSVSFPKLTSVKNSAFYYAFSGCTNLTSISFPELTSIEANYAFYYAFYGSTKPTSVYFPKLTSVIKKSFYEVGDFRLTIHVPKSLSNTTEFITGGSTYGTIVYDL